MRQGWIKLHRQAMDWEWYTEPLTCHLFQHLIMKANFEDKKWRGISVKKGQLITGRNSLSEQTGLSEQQVRTALKNLVASGDISIEPTNKFSLVTVENYSLYQADKPQATSQPTSKQPTDNQQSTTTKELNNIINTTVDDARGGVEEITPVKQERKHVHVGKQVLTAMGISHDDPTWFGSYGIVEMWLNGGYCPELDILPTVQSIMAKRGSDPPRSLNYFTNAIADKNAARNKPLPKGKAYASTSRNSETERNNAAQAQALKDLGVDISDFRVGETVF